MINRNNSEAFFLDYYEGNLSEGQVAELFAFLKANPDQREIFESFSDISIDPDNQKSPDFSFLKKETEIDIHGTAEQWMVDFVDGTITGENKIALEKYLTEFPEKRNDFATFEKTILRADENESLGDITFLKKETAITKNNFEDYAIAMVEGTISENEKSLLETFVLTHPEFQVQLDSFLSAKLKADESVVFDAKSSLKKFSVVVSKENIDELLVAKSEGQLAAHEEQAVDAFVAQHPEYRKELELLAKTKLVADPSQIFEAKNKLKKGSVLITEENFEQYLISASEGLLNGEELNAFNSFVAAHPKYKNALSLVSATRLQPDMNIVYDDKDGLKRKEKSGAIWWSVNIRYAAAAVVVLILGIYFWMKFNNGDPDHQEMANDLQKSNINNGVAPVEDFKDTVQNPSNNDLYVNNSSADSGENKVATIGKVKKNSPGQDQPDQGTIVIIPDNYVPVTIVATAIPNKANDAVNYSTALYATFDRPQADPQAVAGNDDYISPGQLAMRWAKDKIDGTDPVFAQNNNMHGFGDNPIKDKNVDGIDLTQSAVNRVGQSTANGKISMDQREDGTYLNLWNYEVRVSK